MHKCENCEALEEALDLISKELEAQRRRKRELLQTIRLLKRSIINEMEAEHEQENRPIGCPHQNVIGHEWSSTCQDCGKTWHHARPMYVTTHAVPFHQVQPLTDWKAQADGHVDYPGESTE